MLIHAPLYAQQLLHTRGSSQRSGRTPKLQPCRADASRKDNCGSCSGADAAAALQPGECQPPLQPQTQEPEQRLAGWPKKSDLYILRSDGMSCTRETVQACGSLSFSCPSSQQHLLVWKARPKCAMVLKKLGDELTAEFLEVLRYLGEEQAMRVLVEPHEFARLAPLGLPYLYTYAEGDLPELHSHVDFVACLGGDGLILHASLLFRRAIPPIISFKLGSLGFLTCHEFRNFRRHLADVIDGYQELDSCKLLSSIDGHIIQGVYITLRMRLLCTIFRRGQPQEEYEVLNEVVVSRGANPFLTKIEVYEHDTLITKVQADGVMLATPTGSTAYNVAAGGSMVHPNVPAIMFTPICPHSLSFRPVILPDYAELEFRISEDARSPALVCLDGKVFTQLDIGDSVHVRLSPNPVPTINNMDQTTDWFNSIERCFKWNERLEQRQLLPANQGNAPFSYLASDDDEVPPGGPPPPGATPQNGATALAAPLGQARAGVRSGSGGSGPDGMQRPLKAPTSSSPSTSTSTSPSSTG